MEKFVKYNNAELDKMIAEKDALDIQIAELKAKVDNIKDSIIEEMDGRQVDMVETNLNHIFYKPISKWITDTKKLNAYLKDNNLDSKFFKKESITIPLDIRHA